MNNNNVTSGLSELLMKTIHYHSLWIYLTLGATVEEMAGLGGNEISYSMIKNCKSEANMNTF